MRTLLVVGALALLGSACGEPGAGGRLPVLWEAPEFALVDQTGDSLRTAELEGTAWVAHFFFTGCEGVCPLTTARMATLRDSLEAEGLLGNGARLVSISVDPARDSVAALRAYARRFGASPPSEWAFLTGSPPESVRRMIQEGFRLTAHHEPAPGDSATNYQVSHSPRLQLVDPQGRVRASYDATEPASVDRLRSDLAALLR
ncbi:MAG: SCO family protein [Gemmatimonadota bacterium]